MLLLHSQPSVMNWIFTPYRLCCFSGSKIKESASRPAEKAIAWTIGWIVSSRLGSERSQKKKWSGISGDGNSSDSWADSCSFCSFVSHEFRHENLGGGGDSEVAERKREDPRLFFAESTKTKFHLISIFICKKNSKNKLFSIASFFCGIDENKSPSDFNLYL